MNDAASWLWHARRGDFARAWEASDRILQRHIAQPDWSRPRQFQSVWMGQPFDGRRVLIRCYHGLGDTIQFIRYAPMVRALAREVIVWAPLPLIPLLQTVDGIDRVLPLHDGTPDVEYDVDVEVMELPFVFRTTLETIPRQVPYITARRSTLPGTSPRVGVAWRASEWEQDRSMAFDELRPLFEIERITWCTLQHGRRSMETDPRLLDISSPSLDEAAARVAALDLLITIDAMPAHLAGALGIPVWTLLLADADWRWMQSRDDSPWYPTMRLFRRRVGEDWAAVIARVREAARLI